MLAGHTHRAHGIDRHELREAAGLTRGAPVCAPEHSAAQAERGAGKRLPDVAYGRIKGAKRKFSEAGKAAQRAKSLAIDPEVRARATRASADRTLALYADRHAEILRRYHTGEPILEIAAAVEVRPSTVRACLKREGVWVDGRTRRWAAPATSSSRDGSHDG